MRTLLERAAPARLCHFHPTLLSPAFNRPFSQFRHPPNRAARLSLPCHDLPYTLRSPPCQKNNRGYGVRSSSKRSDPRGGSGISASESAPPTDFAKLDVLGNLPQPGGSIDSCLSNGFNFTSGLTVTGGVLILGGEVFRWFPTPDEAASPHFLSPLLNDAGQWEVGGDAFGALDVVWPKPGTLSGRTWISTKTLDLLVIGTGRATEVLSPNTKKLLNSMGIRVEVVDTRNAAAEYNLLAVERGIHEVAAALVPAGWKAEISRVTRHQT
jgi:NADH dehydrogenase [ubiquinone] 1 alpha subcomplex assembly factor 3